MNKLFLPLVVSVLCILGLSYYIYQINFEKDVMKEVIQSSELEIGKAKVSLGEVNKYVDELETKIQEDIKYQDALVTKYAHLEALLKAKGSGKGKVEKVVQKETIYIEQDLGLEIGMLYQALSPSMVTPLESLGIQYQDHRLFFVGQIIPQKGSLDLENRAAYELSIRFGGDLIETIDPEGRLSYYMDLYELDPEGEKLGKIALNNFGFVLEDKRFASFDYWNPTLDIGLEVFGNTKDTDILPSLGISFMSYGLSDNSGLLFRFGRVSVLPSKDPVFSLVPAMANLGPFIPLINDLWLGLGASTNTSRDFFLTLSLSTIL